MKKIICAITLFVTVVLACSAAFGNPQEVYTDIKGSYAEKAILELTAQGILKGAAPGQFKPDQNITRGHFCLLLAKTLGVLPFYPEQPSFSDVSQDNPAFGSIEALTKLGIIGGYQPGNFKPDLPLARQDAAVIICRILNENQTGELTYRDKGSIAPYAAQAVTTLSQKKWLNGYNDFFYPLQGLTRAQAALLSLKLFERQVKMAQGSLQELSPKQLTIKTGEQLTLAQLSSNTGLNFTTVYGSDNPVLGSVTPEGVYEAGRQSGKGLITVNNGSNFDNVQLTTIDNEGNSEENNEGNDGTSASDNDDISQREEQILNYSYSVKQTAPDSAYQKMEYKQYSGPVDGLSSGTDTWTGFLRQQGREITVDLGQVKSVDSISLEFKQDANSGILMPEYLNCLASVDGEAWYRLGRVSHSVIPGDKTVQTKTLGLSFPSLYIRYIKLSFPVDVYVFARHLTVKGGLAAERPVILPGDVSAGSEKPSYLSIPGIKDIMLIFSGANGASGEWGFSDFSPLVGYMDQNGLVKDRMFDTMLFLPFPGSTGNLQAWQSYLNDLFAPGKQLGALDDVVATINDSIHTNTKQKVILTIPYPDSQQQKFGTLNGGKELSFSEGEVGREQALQNRLSAVQWYYNELTTKWREAGYSNLELVGMYWYKENMDTKIPDETELVQNVAQMVDSDGYSFFWIPYFGANGYQTWQSIGFNYVILQPNFYATDNPPEDRINDVSDLAQRYHTGTELELDDKVTYSRYYYDLFYQQLRKGHEVGLDGDVTNAYYAGAKTILTIRDSSIPQVRAIYDDLYRWIKGQYTP